MIDLHVHSTASDGTFTPEELAEKGKSFSVMAITDHDNCAGAARFLSAAREVSDPSCLRLAGIELSIEPGAGYRKFHLLGLGIDPEAPCLIDFLEEIRAGRNERNVLILRKLNDLGIPLEMEDVRKFSDGRIVARPHFGRALVEKGFATDVKDAFAKYLGDGAAAYVTRYHPPQAAAIDCIHRAGGVAVMAHPRYWTDDPAALRKGLARLKDLGLDGIEAVYQANLPGETVDHLRAARELGLAVTAGSDFHGANKPAVTLGMTVKDEEAFLAPFRAALAQNA